MAIIKINRSHAGKQKQVGAIKMRSKMPGQSQRCQDRDKYVTWKKDKSNRKRNNLFPCKYKKHSKTDFPANGH